MIRRGSMRIWFEPGNMGGFRSGYQGEDGLYDLTFRRGWHGGALRVSEEKSKIYGVHPGYLPGGSVSVWRGGGTSFSQSGWGAPAAVSSPSPLLEIKEKFDEYQHEQLRDDFLAIWNQNKYKIQINIK